MDSLNAHKTKRRCIRRVASIIALLVCTLPGSVVAAKPVPKYLDAVKQEIARLGYEMSCRETEGICTISPKAASDASGSTASLSGPIEVIIDDESATVRFVRKNFLPLTELSGETAKKLLTLNNDLMVAKISVEDKTGAIVLSAVVNTDSNFDRKTFRSVLRGFVKVADELAARFTPQENQN